VVKPGPFAYVSPMRRLFDAILKPYANADYALQHKARFVAVACVVLLVIAPIAIAYNVSLSLSSPSLGHAVNPALIGVLIAGSIVLAPVLLLLSKGRFTVAIHLLITSSFAVFWTIMLVDKATAVARLDTITFVLAVLSMAPLSVTRRGWVIAAYAAANIVALVVFVLLTRAQLDAPSDALIDFVANSSIAMIFISIVGWSIFVINRDALARASADIEARRSAEADASLKSAMLEAQAEAAYDGVLFVDGKGNIILANRKFSRLWGMPSDVVEGRSEDKALDHAITAVRDPDQFLKSVRAVYEQRSGPTDDEVELADGRTLERHSEPVIDTAGTYLGRVWYFRDITERKNDEQRVRASEARYRAVVEDQTDMIARFSTEGVITFANGALERYCGADSLVGCDVRKLLQIPGAELLARRLGALSRESTIEELEYSFVGNDCLRRWSVWSVRALHDADGVIQEIQVVGRDITERKEAEQERERLQDQLRQAQKLESIGRLAGGVAHDFNNLLTAILGNIQLALMDAEAGRSPRNCLSEATKAAQSAASLTRQLLAFSRKQLIEPRVLDLNQLLEQMLRMVARVIGEDVTLQANIGNPIGLIKADASQIEQIVVNLAVNARDAMPEGGRVTIETADVVLDAEFCRQHPDLKPGPFVLLSVSDDGIGMSAEVRRHLFEPFFTTKPKGKGTGLGLATVYGAVSQHGGFISVESAKGSGSTFRIYFPRAEGAPDSSHRLNAAAELPKGSETIVLVEDEPQVLAFTEGILTRLGYTVAPFPNAEDALAHGGDVLRTAPLLITDVILPGINGRALSTKLTQANPALKTLFASGYAEDVIGHHGVLDAGVLFIPKPYTASELARKVREVLDALPDARVTP